MAQFSAFPVWTDAYLGDTKHLTTLEHGAYLLILFAMWRAGGTLPNDDKRLSRIAGVHSNQWTRIRDNIMDFMSVSEDGQTVTQGRLADELEYVRAHSKKQAKNAKARWKTVQHPPGAVEQHPLGPEYNPAAKPLEDNKGGDATALFWQCQTDAPTPAPLVREDTNVSSLSEPAVADLGRTKAGKRKGNSYNPGYETFWRAYPSTEGMSKLDGFKAWQKLATVDQARAIASLRAYAAHLKTEGWKKVKHVQGYLNSRLFESFAGNEKPIDWQGRLVYGRHYREWPVHQWGPMPGQVACEVPSDLLQPGDGSGWAVARAA